MIGKYQAMAPYYRLLARKIALAIVVVAFIPYALTFGLFYSSYDDFIRGQVLGSLQGVVETHKRDIDGFLGERLADLRAVADLLGVEKLKQPQEMKRAFAALRDAHSAFIDLGVIDSQGRHLAYAGPYNLQGADYSQSEWFQTALSQGSHVSDVFLGLRKVPHFVAAIKVNWQGQPYLLRATIDSARFATLVEKVRLGSSGEAFIVNRQGLRQTQGRQQRPVLTSAGLEPPAPFAGVRVWETTANGGREVVMAQTWLKNGDWLLICQQDTSDAFEPLHQARRLVLVCGLAAMGILVVTIVLLTQNLVGRIAQTDKEKELLNEQIIQASKLASLGELAAGVAHEINNPLAIMVEEAGWMQDLLTSDGELLAQSHHYPEYQRALSQIQTHGRRCKEITVKLLGFARSTYSPLQPTQINDLAREVAGLLERPARLSNVVLKVDLAADLPQIMASPTELQQVLMNLVNNAVDAMEGIGGEITLRTTQGEKGTVLIEVADNGPGIPEAVLSRIFDPFFTTKPVGKGTGLGLSICYGIVHKLGGRLEAKSTPGQGATFRVYLPAPAKGNKAPLKAAA